MEFLYLLFYWWVISTILFSLAITAMVIKEYSLTEFAEEIRECVVEGNCPVGEGWGHRMRESCCQVLIDKFGKLGTFLALSGTILFYASLAGLYFMPRIFMYPHDNKKISYPF